MKKLLTILSIFICVQSFAQVYQTQNSYGFQYKHFKIDSTLHIPTFCGVPTLNGSGVGNQGAIAIDSCNHKLYFYDPKDSSWDIVGGGTLKKIYGGYGITEINDSTLAIDTAVLSTYYVPKSDSISGYVTPTQLAGIHNNLNLYYPLYGNNSDTSVHFRNDSLPLLTYGPGVDTSGSNAMDVPVKKWVLDRISSSGGGAVASVTGSPSGLVDNTDPANPVIQEDALKLAIADTSGMLANYATQINTNIVNIANNTVAITTKLNISDTANKWLSGVDSVAANTLRFYKGAGHKDFVFTGTDTSSISNRINLKVNISDTLAMLNPYKYKVDTIYRTVGKDSIQFKINGVYHAIIDSAGGGGGSSPYTDTSFIQVVANNLLSTTPQNKGLKLANFAVSGISAENTPPLVFRGGQNGNPFFYQIYGLGNVGNGELLIRYSTDSTTWTTVFTLDRLGNISSLSTGSFSSYVSATLFAGTKMNLVASGGNGVIGANRAANPLASLELPDTTRGILINRVSNLQKKKIGTSVYLGTITSGGSGYTNGTGSYTFTGGSGISQQGNFTVSGGVITAVTPLNISGYGYKKGDVLSANFGGGTGFSFTVTKLLGDTASGLMVIDTTLNCLSVYNKTQQRWENSSTSNTYTASGNGTSTTITIPHELTNATSSSLVWVTAKNAASANIGYVTIDATNVYINYTIAPASGTNNLLYDIQIKKE